MNTLDEKMIEFVYNTKFEIENEESIKNWIGRIIREKKFTEGDLMYIFCDDEELLEINLEFLNHDTYTDIISFDYTMGKLISGEIYISIDRVRENAESLNVSFQEELGRVMIHGILHFMGFKDETPEESAVMRAEEDQALSLLFEA